MISDAGTAAARTPQDFSIRQFRIDLTAHTVTGTVLPCADLEDALGGIARGFKVLEEHPTDDPYAPSALLVMNLGLLTGTDLMTGLRTYFHGYSPLKAALSGQPSAMWSTGSGNFGVCLRNLEVDEVHFTGRCDRPTLLRLRRDTPDGPTRFEFEDAAGLCGLNVNDRMKALHARFPNAHFAVIGPSGENFTQCRFAAIALSTDTQLRTGDNKPRFCGRGGMGGVMGSKNLLAIVAEEVERPAEKGSPLMKELNQEVARGKGSAKFRDKSKNNGGGGTWANVDALNPLHAMPEMNFVPTGTRVSLPLYRDNFEQGSYVVKDESCFRCGIACHKNVYDEAPGGKPGRFRAKLDFEPLNLLSSNIGIFRPEECLELCELVDELCMDSISVGTLLSYVMEYNRRHPDRPIAHGLKYGDYATSRRVIEDIAQGRLPELGQGVMRLSLQLHETGYAMHSKGVEYPAYLPQTNPGYPWALAGGHMSMRTYLLLLVEKDTGLDYWVDAVAHRGPLILRDDILGGCKFTGLSDDNMVKAITALTGLQITKEELHRTIRRVFLRGYRLELRQGFTDADYAMPDEIHNEYPQIRLPHFNTREFFGQLRDRVQTRLRELLVEEGMA